MVARTQTSSSPVATAPCSCFFSCSLSLSFPLLFRFSLSATEGTPLNDSMLCVWVFRWDWNWDWVWDWVPPTSYVDRDGANASSSAVYEGGGRCKQVKIGSRGRCSIHTFNLAMRAPSLCRNIVRLSGLILISQVSMMLFVLVRKTKVRKSTY